MSTTPVRIDDSTISRLKIFKKKYKSYDSVITAFVDYFEATGINPSEIQTSPISMVKKRTDDIIKIMKGIEKETNKKLNRIEGFVELNYNKNNPGVQPDFSDSDLEELNNHIAKIEAENKAQINTISNLKKDLLEAKSVTNNQPVIDNESTFQLIRSELSKLINSKEISRLAKGSYQIEKGLFEAVTSSIFNLTK